MSKIIVDEIQTNTVNGNVRIIPNGTGELEVTGNCSATTFSGSGANLTNIPTSAITGLSSGGSLEFVKKISLTGNQTSIVEYGLDYDTVYRFNLNHVRTGTYTLLRVYPHVDNSATKHNNGDCSAHYMVYSGNGNSASSNDGWYFSNSGWLTKSSGYFEIYTGADSWINASINYHSGQGQSFYAGWKLSLIHI